MAWYNPTDPTQRNWMLGGIVVLALIYPFLSFFMTPRNEANDVVRDRLESLEIQNRQARKKSRRWSTTFSPVPASRTSRWSG
jgi:predicted LPLAT superfamily acyltransferase